LKSSYWKLYRLAWKTLFHARPSHARWTFRRAFVMTGFLPMILLGQTFHWLCLWLDDVLFRGWRSVEVREPVFILGIPRSGTTFLHRVMAKDSDNFTTMNLWEMVFAPSITERRFWMAIGAVDRALGGFGRKLLLALENRAFESVRKIHKISLFEPEEDDLALFPIAGSAFMLFPFPFPDELWHLVEFDSKASPEEKDRVMGFYRDCIKRHLYVHGPEKRFLSKNPAMSPKLDALREYFPDARVVCNVRTPYSALPSLLSFLSFNWSRFDNDPLGDRFRDLVLDIAEHWYRWPMERLPEYPDNRGMFLTYDELTAHPQEAVAALYQRLELPLTSRFAAVLAEEHEKARGYKSRHKYSLEEYGLTPEAVFERYRDVFERFEFDAAQHPATTRAQH
jgi:hypothetical protein